MQAQRERAGSLVDALSRVLEAGQRVLIDRVELALTEARSAFHVALGDATLAAAAVLFLLLPAWLSALALAALWLAEHWSLEKGLATLALVQLGVGVALLGWIARRRASQPLRREVR
jgi:uncharacterized membrane protein YGL010W